MKLIIRLSISIMVGMLIIIVMMQMKTTRVESNIEGSGIGDGLAVESWIEQGGTTSIEGVGFLKLPYKISEEFDVDNEAWTLVLPKGEQKALEELGQENLSIITADLFVSEFREPKVIKVEDGFLVAYIQGDPKDVVGYLTLSKLDVQGRTVFETVLSKPFEKTAQLAIGIFSDGSFCVSIGSFDSLYTDQDSLVYGFNVKGTKIWEYVQTVSGNQCFTDLFITSKDEVVLVGSVEEVKIGKSYIQQDIIVTRMDKEGQVMNQAIFGGKDNDYLQSVAYDETLGFIISGWSRGSDGPFNLGLYELNDMDDFEDYHNSISYVAYINNDFELKWVINRPEEDRYSDEALEIVDGNIYISGAKYFREEDLPDAPGALVEMIAFWQCITSEGVVLTEGSMGISDIGEISLSVLSPDKIVMMYGDFQNEGKMILFDGQGLILSQIDKLEFSPEEVVFNTKDEFIVKGRHYLDRISQPMWSSYIAVDQEVVFAKYNDQLDLIWRKVFDDYKESLLIDRVTLY